MLTESDIKNLMEAQKQVFATREDFGKLSGLVLTAKDEVADLKEDIVALRESVQAMTIAIDRLVKSTETLHQEYSAFASRINRHEQWIKQLADKIGLKLDS